MSTDLRTIGHLMRDAGYYYTAYKGKWHLTKELETVNELGSPTIKITERAQFRADKVSAKHLDVSP
jgi:arylsulfatase A-like enzyme